MKPRASLAAAARASTGALVVFTTVAALPGVPPQQRGQAPVYGARVEMVRVHAAVLDGDGPVTDLAAEDFIVIDNGVTHEVALALTPTETAIDVALVFDQSDSIRQAAPTVKRDARAFLDALGADDCAFVLPFQHLVGPGLWGPSMAPALLDIVDLTPLEGGTSLNDALVVGLSELQGWNVPAMLAPRVVTEYRQPTIEGGVGIDLGDAATAPRVIDPEPDVAGFGRADLPFRVFDREYGCGNPGASGADRRKALVVLSDGVDTTSVHTFGELLRLVHETDVPVFPVAIGNPGAGAANVNRDMRRAARDAEQRLQRLAELTGGRFVRGSGSQSQLREAYGEIITILRGSYLLGYYPRGDEAPDATEGEGHEVTVRVRRRGVDVFARTEYHRSEDGTQRARAVLRRGAELIRDGRLDEALEAARAASAVAPDLWDGHFLEAAALWMDGRADAALAPLQRALWLAPGVAAAHSLAWRLHFDRGDDAAAWQHAIRAHVAGADMQEPLRMLAARATPPAGLQARLGVSRVFVGGSRGADAAAYSRLEGIGRALARAVSDSPYLGLVRDPMEADYSLYLDAEEADRRRPRALRSRIELYNYVDQRLWRDDLDVADLDDEDQVAAAVASAMEQLEEWFLGGR